MRNPLDWATKTEMRVMRLGMIGSIAGVVACWYARTQGINPVVTADLGNSAVLLLFLPFIFPPLSLVLFVWELNVSRFWAESVSVASVSAGLSAAYALALAGNSGITD